MRMRCGDGQLLRRQVFPAALTMEDLVRAIACRSARDIFPRVPAPPGTHPVDMPPPAAAAEIAFE